MRYILILAAAALLTAPAAHATGWHTLPRSSKAPTVKPRAHKPKPKPTPALTAGQIGDALSVLPREGERAGFCAPVPLPRVGEPDGIFYNGYLAATDGYLALGFTVAKVDAAGAIYC